MSTQSTVTDPENPSDSDESTTDCSSAYAELLSTSSLEELGEKGFEVKLAINSRKLCNWRSARSSIYAGTAVD
jgi:hypothetical protein